MPLNMGRLCALLATVLLTGKVLTQAVEPSAPPKIVSQHAQNVLSSDGGSACENAVRLPRWLPSQILMFLPVCSDIIEAVG
jgi:hypothetical protein